MNFEKINIIKSHAVITTIENIDTDQIIPARFLKTTTREGFGDNMFYDWRYNDKRDRSVNLASQPTYYQHVTHSPLSVL